MIGILGSGFGLYGYFPAITSFQKGEVLLLERYKEKFYSRKELFNIDNRILWVNNMEELLTKSKMLIICLPPKIQVDILLKCINFLNIEKLVLEKPLAPTPTESIHIISVLKNSKINFRIGYTFEFTNWSKQLIKLINSKKKKQVIVNWLFNAHHYKNQLHNWKRVHSEGGGVLRFYGIHLIALASKIGYSEVSLSRVEGYSDEDYNNWDCVFTNNSLPDLVIHINTNSKKTEFSIESILVDNNKNNKNIEILQSDPFFENVEDKLHQIQDPRVHLLKKLIKTFDSETSTEYYNLYYNTILLWEKIEKNTKIFVIN